MKHPVYSYEKTRAMFERAIEVIPSGLYGHQGPAEGCHIPPSAFPQFSSRAKGAYFWDLDGNRFIDYMCAYGPNILGYGDPDVDEAARRQMEIADCVTAPPSLIVDFAELMVETVASADWAFFAKNGGDVTTAAIMTARAPSAFAAMAAIRPIGPGPKTTTKSSGSTFPRSSRSVTMLAVGSASAAST